MKNTLKSSLLALVFLFSALFTGCSSDDSSDLSYSDDEIAELLAESFVASGLYNYFFGLASYADLQTLKARNLASSASCNQTETTSLDESYSEGGFTSSIVGTVSYTVNCLGDIPDSVGMIIDLNATVSGQDFSTSFDYDVDMLLGNLAGTGPFTIAGSTSYDGDGSYSGESFVFGYSSTLVNGTIDRETYTPTGGTGTISMDLTDPNGGSGTVTAQYSIGSDGNVTVTFNGKSYLINPSFGLVS